MRKLDLEEFVDEIFEDYEKNKDTDYVFFLGAGCSVSSGIKLASELAEEWYEELKKQKLKFEKFNKENKINPETTMDYGKYYFQIFEALFPTPLAQQKEIQKITEDKTPSLGYYVLSELMQKNQFNTIITTNFDNLIQDALIYTGNKRALVITHEDLAKFIKRDHTPLITKIHGDAHMHPFNNSNDTKAIPNELKVAIQGLCINAKIIFLGYKGNDESIVNLLEGCKRIDQVYWFGSNEPESSKLGKWWNELNTKTFIQERNFDKVMSLIKSKFNLAEPDFQKRWEILENSYKNALVEEIEEIETIQDENKTFIDYLILGNTYYSNKNYQNASTAFEKASILNPKDDSVFNNWGNALAELAKVKDNDEKLYTQAIEKYEKASIFNPKDANIFNNWGTALFKLAHAKENDEKLYAQAIEKLNFSIKLGGKSYNLACLYSLKGEKDKALELLEESLEKKEIEAKFVLEDDDDDWNNLKKDNDFIKLVNKYK